MGFLTAALMLSKITLMSATVEQPIATRTPLPAAVCTVAHCVRQVSDKGHTSGISGAPIFGSSLALHSGFHSRLRKLGNVQQYNTPQKEVASQRALVQNQLSLPAPPVQGTVPYVARKVLLN